MTVMVKPDGAIVAIYDDAILPVIESLGDARIERASNVEPVGHGWQAVMSDGVVGPVTRTRSESLEWERAYIKENF